MKTLILLVFIGMLVSCGTMRTAGMKPTLVSCGSCSSGSDCELYYIYDPHYFNESDGYYLGIYPVEEELNNQQTFELCTI